MGAPFGKLPEHGSAIDVVRMPCGPHLEIGSFRVGLTRELLKVVCD